MIIISNDIIIFFTYFVYKASQGYELGPFYALLYP